MTTPVDKCRLRIDVYRCGHKWEDTFHHHYPCVPCPGMSEPIEVNTDRCCSAQCCEDAVRASMEYKACEDLRDKLRLNPDGSGDAGILWKSEPVKDFIRNHAYTNAQKAKREEKSKFQALLVLTNAEVDKLRLGHAKVCQQTQADGRSIPQPGDRVIE